MGLEEFFTNKEKTKDGKVDIDTPAFSVTKVVTVLGAIIGAVLAVVPAQLKEETPVVIAAVASGTLVLLGIFTLVAVDIRTRQKAKAATLRFGDGKPAEADFIALPVEDLVLQRGHNKPEYEVSYLKVEGGAVHLYARNGASSITATFEEAVKPK